MVQASLFFILSSVQCVTTLNALIVKLNLIFSKLVKMPVLPYPLLWVNFNLESLAYFVPVLPRSPEQRAQNGGQRASAAPHRKRSSAGPGNWSWSRSQFLLGPHEEKMASAKLASITAELGLACGLILCFFYLVPAKPLQRLLNYSQASSLADT